MPECRPVTSPPARLQGFLQFASRRWRRAAVCVPARELVPDACEVHLVTFGEDPL
eukprot:CAMPEP_0205939466 /NCGR_PEP_ID=MMETSP1325-20131115/49713_1 /ASSEMBLY_ACC=CAM_ASM_000708 /TAXON_ID=236786 /ORGANISM="Florenciella sp., Strain RCC1007" /LENGTH=54 /DNA_ID=CAMNT_0053309939 /DNA_START=187 /DNA_END=347 /DNA_ORIENTATION=+